MAPRRPARGVRCEDGSAGVDGVVSVRGAGGELWCAVELKYVGASPKYSKPYGVQPAGMHAP